MLGRRKNGCGRCRRFGGYGPVLIALGIGLILAYLIPYYILIVILGAGLVTAGVVFSGK